MKIGLFGGNFDPIHTGHLITAQYVYEKRHLDKIIFMPAAISPFKVNNYSSSKDLRIQMIQAAIEGIKHFEVSDIELKREGISFTVDTVKELKKIYDSIDLIIGYDNYVNFNKWKDPEIILSLCNVVVLKRIIDNDNIDNYLSHKMEVLNSPLIQISSTEIRKRIQNNLSIKFLVPEKVENFIYTNSLYK